MMISTMSNNEWRDYDANKNTNGAYKLNIWIRIGIEW